MLKQIDARGLACPQPVLLAKKEWTSNRQPFTILVDNFIAVQNLQKLAQSLCLEIKVQANSELSAQGLDESFTVAFIGAQQSTENGIPTSHTDSNVSRETFSFAETTTTTAALPEPLKPFTLFVGKDYIGEGNPELGQQLMNMYFYTLSQSESLPCTIAFMNKGVFLPTTNGQVIEHLKILANKGCKILVCGACLNFYNLKEKLQVGEISNMYEIWTQLSAHNSIVSL